MPILEHDYHIPLEKKSIIWRYIDFWKFETMLKDVALYFCRQDIFSDPFEGSLPKREIESRKKHFKDLEIISSKFNSEKGFKEMAEEHREQKRRSYLNCWHINNTESASMWKCYVEDNEGIAIQSTCERIYETLKSVKENVGISKVRYIDFNNEDVAFNHLTEYPIDSYSILTPLIHKRIEFEDEKEFRIYYKDDSNSTIENKLIKPKGINIKIDLNKLIDKIILNPNADDVIINRIKDITKVYGYSFELCPSKLSSYPSF